MKVKVVLDKTGKNKKRKMLVHHRTPSMKGLGVF